jgi:hypothetical protein
MFYSAQQYGLPPGFEKADIPAHGLLGTSLLSRARAEDRKLRKDPSFGGPCFEGTLQKPPFSNLASESSPVAGAIQGFNPCKPLDAGRARELQKCAQPATQMLSVHCLYQMNFSRATKSFERQKITSLIPPSLLGVQRFDRIHRRRPPCGQIARRERGHAEGQRDACQRKRVPGLRAE